MNRSGRTDFANRCNLVTMLSSLLRVNIFVSFMLSLVLMFNKRCLFCEHVLETCMYLHSICVRIFLLINEKHKMYLFQSFISVVNR